MTLMLIGNPNVGKTTLFNNLTGQNAQVANWSGATVDKLSGTILGTEASLIDLPGTYSLTPGSEDEGVVTSALIHEEFGGIVNIVDASRLKRNLHLTIQLLETGRPVVVALNMMDELHKQGKVLDTQAFEGWFPVQAVAITARKKEGMDELLSRLEGLDVGSGWQLDYGPTLEAAIRQLQELLSDVKQNPRWLAIQILEGNSNLLALIDEERRVKARDICAKAQSQIIAGQEAQSLKGAIFNCRRAYIAKALAACVGGSGDRSGRGRFDRFVTHPFWGMVTFFALMFFVYTVTFDWVGNPLSDMFDAAIRQGVIPWAQRTMAQGGIMPGSFFYEGVAQGFLAGVGGVIVFMPQILILFFCLSVMEGTGYMARIALVMDSLFSRFGLNGKAIVPLITGFGCNVPAMMATRTIKDRHQRLKTMTIIPFMSCSARLPVYVLFVGLFFPYHQAPVIMGLYLLGMAVALASSRLLSATVFKRSAEPFILEVPPYRVPQLGLVLRQTLDKGRDFIQSAGKFIVLGSFIMWLLQYAGPGGLGVDQNDSFLAVAGGVLAPLVAPLGLGRWEVASSLVVGFFAKELLASSMIVIAGSELAIGELFNLAQAASFLIFSLLYIPCLATVGVMYRESNSLKSTIKMLLYGLAAAYAVSFLAYRLILLII